MKTLLLFSFDMSLTEWVRLGLYNREMGLYRNLANEYDVDVDLLTYGMEDDCSFETNRRINVIPSYAGRRRPTSVWIRLFASFLLPIRFADEFKSADLYKSNQMSGSWVGVVAKILYRKPFLLRCGYELSEALKLEKARMWKRISAWVLSFVCYHFATQILVPTDDIKNLINKKFLIKKAKINVHPNSVDTRIFSASPDELQRKSGILFVGRLTYQKNIFLLLDAVLDLDVDVTIVGAGELLKDVKERINVGRNNVTLLRDIPNDELAAIYKESLIYVLCSRYEGNPKSLIEAMACGCAVVGTAVSGIKNMISHEKTGILVTEDKNALRQALLQLIQSREICATLGRAARELVVEKFSLSQSSAREREIYDTLVSTNRKTLNGDV
jgi:glycosyltransferase involved in cell wall biosynthesis